MLRREAAAWLVRLQSGRDPDIERKFRRWYDDDPKHAAAFDRVKRTYEQARLLRQSPVLAAPAALGMPQERGWHVRPALAAAAALALLLPAGAVLVRSHGLATAGIDAVMLTTQVGEIRQVELADGSSVTLDTSTKVEVKIDGSRRVARLDYGRARFEVVRGGKPFIVEAAGAAISVAQGTFDVEQIGQRRFFQVLAGTAQVKGSGRPPLLLRAGERTRMNAAGTEKGEVAGTPDWTGGMLQFDGTSIGEAVGLANRYSNRHIELSGDLAALRVSGGFRAGDTEGLAEAFAAAFDLSLEQRPDGNLLLSRKAPLQRQNKRGG